MGCVIVIQLWPPFTKIQSRRVQYHQVLGLASNLGDPANCFRREDFSHSTRSQGLSLKAFLSYHSTGRGIYLRGVLSTGLSNQERNDTPFTGFTQRIVVGVAVQSYDMVEQKANSLFATYKITGIGRNWKGFVPSGVAKGLGHAKNSPG